MKTKKGISVQAQFLISNALLILVFAIGGMVINSNYFSILRKEVSQQAMQDLVKSADLFESRLVDLGNCAYTVSQVNSVVTLSRADTLSIDEYALLHRMDQQIRSCYQSNGFIDSIIIWFQKSGSLWMESGFLDASLVKTIDQNYLVNGVPFSRFSMQQHLADKTSRLELVNMRMAGQDQTQLVYVFSMNPLSNFRTDAYALVLIDMEQAMRLLSFAQYEEEGARFRIVERDGHQIYPLADASADAYFSDVSLLEESITPVNDFTLFTYNPGGSGLYYQLSLPASYLDSLVRAGQKTSLIVTAFSIVLTALLAWFLARKNAKPVYQLVELACTDSTDVNQFHVLHESLSQMLRDRRQMEASLQNYLDLQKNMVFSNLLSYGFRSEEKAMEALSEVNIMPDAAFYGVAYLHFTSPEAMEGTATHLVLTTILGRLTPGLMHVCPMSSSSYAFVYAFKDADALSLLNRQLDYALTEFKHQYQMIVTLVVGPAVTSLLELPESFQIAQRAYHALDLSERGKVIQVTDQAPKPESVWHLQAAQRHRLISLCQAGDYDMLECVLRQFFEERIQRYAPSKLEVAQLAYDLRSMFIQLQQQTAGISTETAALSVNTLPNNGDCHQLLEETLALFRAFCQQITHYKENSAHRLYISIQDYIRDHFTDPNLSLAGIADAFNMNDKYLSQFYKKEGHINLAAEIEELRLNQAIALMKNDDATLAEICSDCGYASLNSFYKAFRRVYAVSPSTYRQSLKDTNT